MKLNEITADHPIVIDLVNQRVNKDEPVFFTLVGDKKREKQKRVIGIGTKPQRDGDMVRYSIAYVNYDQDPADTEAREAFVQIPDRHFAVATLEKHKDGSWLLNIPNTPFAQLKAA